MSIHLQYHDRIDIIPCQSWCYVLTICTFNSLMGSFDCAMIFMLKYCNSYVLTQRHSRDMLAKGISFYTCIWIECFKLFVKWWYKYKRQSNFYEVRYGFGPLGNASGVVRWLWREAACVQTDPIRLSKAPEVTCLSLTWKHTRIRNSQN